MGKRGCEECKSFYKTEETNEISCAALGFRSIVEVRTIFPGFPDEICRFFRSREQKYPLGESKFPRMKAFESEIFDRFLELNQEFKSCDFDVHIGLPKSSRYAKLTMRRVDAISYVGNEAWILKVIFRLRPGALGELKVWGALYKPTKAGVEKVRLGVVCPIDDPELKPIFEEEGIRVFVVHSLA